MIGDALSGGMKALTDGWNSWLSNPANRAALVQTGVALMQPMSIGQNPLGQIGMAIGQGAEAKDRYEASTRSEEQQQYERNQAAADRATKDAQFKTNTGLEQQKIGIMGRNAAVSERNAASLEAARRMNPGGLSALFARDQDQLTNKLWAAAQAEATNANNSLDAFNEGFVPKTPQDYLNNPEWLAKTQALLGKLPGMPGNSMPPVNTGPQPSAQPSTIPPNSGVPQPVPQPTAPTPRWKIGDVQTTPQGTFKLMQINGQYQWQKVM